ncbi:UDP-N-acetylmuramoyl-tripeptide--D-alanyl-D-alanine ligase [Lichenicoccus sp.]|uniref:UDP-N-acetylmuramoyl-tripeptide--D-alanyl-D- alanine ligase n=1 Tax=Lichenicoccus sp. TaxID=2781899 RepID=UPI003D095BCF
MSALWTAEDLRAATGGVVSGPIAANGVSIDTRSLAAGDLFIALRGDNGNGHAHVAAALAGGAAGAVVHATVDAPLGDDPRLLRVADTQAALADLGRFARARFGGRLVAVTGSVGKTTTKEMLRVALGALRPTHVANASHNNHWGVPLTLSRLPPTAAFCVCEIGMNHPGEIAPLAALARPDVAVITSIEAAHIGQMGSLKAIAEEKAALVRSLQPGGVAILPDGAPGMADATHAARARGLRVIRFGTGPECEARLSAMSLDADGSRLTMTLEGATHQVLLAAPGRHMAMNALACLAAVCALGGDIAQAAAGLADFRPGVGRGALRALPGDARLLDESYNASGASVRAALEVMRLTPAQRRVVVLGDMLELGAFSLEEHESLNSYVRDSADIVYCCGSMMTKLYELLPATLQGACAPDSRMLAPLVAAALRPGDLVLVKGSNDSRMRLVVDALLSGARLSGALPGEPG